MGKEPGDDFLRHAFARSKLQLTADRINGTDLEGEFTGAIVAPVGLNVHARAISQNLAVNGLVEAGLDGYGMTKVEFLAERGKFGRTNQNGCAIIEGVGVPVRNLAHYTVGGR